MLSLFLALALSDTIRIGQVRIVDAEIAALVAETTARSPHFAAGLDTIARGETPVIIGRLDQIQSRVPERFRKRPTVAFAHAIPDPAAYDRRHTPGAVVPLAEIMVAVDLDHLRRSLDAFGVAERIQAELGGTLAHELIGHALGWSRSDDLLRGCDDPGHRELVADPHILGCAVERENRVRIELGLRPRRGYADNPFSAPARVIMMAYRPRQTAPVQVRHPSLPGIVVPIALALAADD